MGRGAIDFDDVVRGGLGSSEIYIGKLPAWEELLVLMRERLEDRGPISAPHRDADVRAFLAGRFPHTEAAKALGDHLGIDWTVLTAAIYLPELEQQMRGRNWPYDSAYTYRIGLALRIFGQRGAMSIGEPQLPAVLEIGRAIHHYQATRRFEIDEPLTQMLNFERGRIERDEPLPADYVPAAERARAVLRKAASSVPDGWEERALDLGISQKQTTLLFERQLRELSAPNWQAAQSACNQLGVPAAPFWLCLSSEGMPFYQRKAVQGKQSLHGSLRRSYEEALASIDWSRFEEALRSNAWHDMGGHPGERITAQLDKELAFEQAVWEIPYLQLIDSFLER